MPSETPKKAPREIIVTTRTEPQKAGKWSHIENLAKVLSFVAIPVVLAAFGWIIQEKLNTRIVSKDYVQLAVSILTQPKTVEVDPALRSWAVDLLNENSPTKFSSGVISQLKGGTVTLPPEVDSTAALAAGDYVRAESLLQTSLFKEEKELGPDHPAVAITLNNLASIYAAKGNYAGAELLYQRALAITEKTLGPSHPTTVRILTQLAGLYTDMGNYGKAEPLFQKALGMTEKTVGPDHPTTAAILTQLAILYTDMGSYGKAEVLYQRALRITEKTLGPNHPGTAQILTRFARLYYEMGKIEEATKLEARAQAIMSKKP